MLLAGQPESAASLAPSPRDLLATLAAAPPDAERADEFDFEDDDADRELLDAMLDQNPPQAPNTGLVLRSTPPPPPLSFRHGCFLF